MKLVAQRLHRTERNLDILRQADPELFTEGFARLVQPVARQPIVFDPEDAELLLVPPPGTFKNIMFYRGNYYVAPIDSEWPYVGLVRRKKSETQFAYLPCCYRRHNHTVYDVTLEEIWERVRSRLKCSSLEEFQTYIEDHSNAPNLDDLLNPLYV